MERKPEGQENQMISDVLEVVPCVKFNEFSMISSYSDEIDPEVERKKMEAELRRGAPEKFIHGKR